MQEQQLPSHAHSLQRSRDHISTPADVLLGHVRQLLAKDDFQSHQPASTQRIQQRPHPSQSSKHTPKQLHALQIPTLAGVLTVFGPQALQLTS